MTTFIPSRPGHLVTESGETYIGTIIGGECSRDGKKRLVLMFEVEVKKTSQNYEKN
jgi:hypothetical protein